MYHGFHKNNKKQKLFLKRLCDTEDWSDDAEKSDLHHRNKMYFKIY